MRTTLPHFLAGISLALSLAACSDSSTPAPSETTETAIPDPAHNSENSLDWAGLYMGTLPCADCEGIRTAITLRADRTYTIELIYLGKASGHVSESGTFEFSDHGGIVMLGAGESARAYRVGENVLFHLDNDGNTIEGALADAYRIPKVK